MKEYADYANFNVQEYMTSNQISYLSQEDADAAFNKEKQEYLEAKNKVDSFKKEVYLNTNILSHAITYHWDIKMKVDNTPITPCDKSCMKVNFVLLLNEF